MAIATIFIDRTRSNDKTVKINHTFISRPKNFRLPSGGREREAPQAL
jgi:hypothetical protein